MVTVLQLIGAAAVPAIFQVMVWLVLVPQISPPSGAVTTKGPVPAIVWIWKGVVNPFWQPFPPETTPPPVEALSLTVSLNLMVLATAGKVSPFSPPLVAAGFTG